MVQELIPVLQMDGVFVLCHIRTPVLIPVDYLTVETLQSIHEVSNTMTEHKEHEQPIVVEMDE